MGLGFGNPLLYANQSQLARRQLWCGRSWHVYSTLSFSANLQLHWLWEGSVAYNIIVLHLFCEFDFQFDLRGTQGVAFIFTFSPACLYKAPLCPVTSVVKWAQKESWNTSTISRVLLSESSSLWFKRAHDCRCWQPPCLIYSACGGARIVVSGCSTV